MIDKTDLRIGNYVHSKENIGYSPKGIITVETIGYRGINAWQDMGASGEGYYDDIEPIPLTPEWLERMEFEATTKGHYRRDDLGDIYIKHSPQGWLVKVYPSTPITSVKFVHQLQNFYYVICGQEIQLTDTIKT